MITNQTVWTRTFFRKAKEGGGEGGGVYFISASEVSVVFNI